MVHLLIVLIQLFWGPHVQTTHDWRLSDQPISFVAPAKLEELTLLSFLLLHLALHNSSVAPPNPNLNNSLVRQIKWKHLWGCARPLIHPLYSFTELLAGCRLFDVLFHKKHLKVDYRCCQVLITLLLQEGIIKKQFAFALAVCHKTYITE